MCDDNISIYTTSRAHGIYSNMCRDEFYKELDLLCRARDLYAENICDSIVLEFLDNVYAIMTDVLVEQALQEKNVE